MQAKKLETLLRVIAVITTVLYLGMFFLKVWSRSRMLHETGLDIDWAVPANPQSMIALCLATATVALVFLRTGGRLISGALFLIVVAFYIHWAWLTKSILLNMNAPSIPEANRIGNLLIGANVLDILVFAVALIMVISTPVALLQGRDRQDLNQPDLLHPRHS